MCVIMAFAAGAMMNKEEFFNAVYNNWHGYGLVLKDAEDHIQLIKGYDEKGTDPEVVWKLLEDNKDIERFLHVRHSTKGATDDSNVQPFYVFHSSSREVLFMHNGTLTGFGETGGVGKSDTLDFCEKILQPSLLCWWGPEGKADYTDPNFLRLVVDKQWSYGSTGLFVSNDLSMQRIGNNWKEYKHPNHDDDSQGTIWVSNELYFNKVQRGPRFQELEAIRKAREAEIAARSLEEAKARYETDGYTSSEQALVPFDGPYAHNKIKKFEEGNAAKDPSIIRAFNTVTTTWDLDDTESLVKLCSMSYEEWLEWLEEDVAYGQFTTAAFIEHLILHIRKQAIHNASLTHKHKNAEKRLQEISLKKDNNNVETALRA